MTTRDGDAALWLVAGALLAAALLGGAQPDAIALAAARGPGARVQRSDPDQLAARELRRLPGIGPARALAIVRARWDGLRGGPPAWIAIPGIGPAIAAAAGAAGRVEPSSQPAYTPTQTP